MTWALVTGASRGIGKAIALRLAEDGFDIAINFRSNEAAAQEVAAGVEALGKRAFLSPFDVADPTAAATAVDALIAEHDCPHILVNNAGIARDGLFVRMKEDAWDAVIQANLGGFYAVTRPVMRKMLKKRDGRIVNLASLSGQRGNPGQVNYAASKAGLIGATKALALEVASRNITVNAVAPGFIETDMLEGLKSEDLEAMVPAGRLGKPEEIAHVVSFLCSPMAGYVTGQVLGVNGGLHT